MKPLQARAGLMGIIGANPSLPVRNLSRLHLPLLRKPVDEIELNRARSSAKKTVKTTSIEKMLTEP
jgi:hypothetical protein